MKHIIGIVLSIFILTSCSKYEEGPKVNFVAKKERITNKWTPISTFINGIDVSLEYQGDILELTKEDNFTLITKYGDVFHGDWEFSNEKQNVIIRTYYHNSSDAAEVTEWKIIKLRKGQLWLTANIDGKLFEYFLEPAF